MFKDLNSFSTFYFKLISKLLYLQEDYKELSYILHPHSSAHNVLPHWPFLPFLLRLLCRSPLPLPSSSSPSQELLVLLPVPLSHLLSLIYIFFLNHLQITLYYFTVYFLTTKILSYVTTVQSSSDTLVLFNPHTLFWYHWFYQ